MRTIILLLKTILSHSIVVAALSAAFVGPFIVMRFDYAAYTAGAFLVFIIAFIYWPRKKRKKEVEGE